MRRYLASAAIVVGVGGVVGVAALPSPASAATSLNVNAGYAGAFVPGLPVPVRVQVAADRLLASELQVIVDGVSTIVPVEVPGGSEKEFLVVVSTPVAKTIPINVIVRLADGSKAPPTATESVSPIGDQELVGVLPGALGGRSAPGPAPLAVDVGTARFVALGPAELDRAPDSIRALGTIGIGADELSRQAPSTRTGILQWIEAGGRLLVDAPPGTPVAGLPEAWQPGPNGRARAGSGEVRLTAGAMAAGRWAGLVEPTPRPATSGGRIIGGMSLGDSLAQDAGFRLPHLSWMVAFLAAYVVIVGPGLYVFLRRRHRPELAWVAIPLIAVVFTGASWTGGRGLRHATQLVHGTVLATGASGSTASTYLGVSSRSGGTLRVGWPAGWLTGATDAGAAQTTALADVRLSPAGPEGRLPLDANQFGLVAATGPVAGAEGALEVTAVAVADGEARGTLRNGTRLRLLGAAVFVGAAGAEVGPLGPGESRDWSLQVNSNPFGGPPPELTILGARLGADGSNFTNFSLWEIAQQAGIAGRGPGHALAVGWTRDYTPPVRVGGRAAHPEGRTLVLGASAIASGGPRAADLTFLRDVVRTIQGTASVVRFAVPNGRAVDPAKLTLRVPSLPAEVWTGETWTALAITGASSLPPNIVNPACPPPGFPCKVGPFFGPPGTVLGEAALPATAVRDGVIYVRFSSGIPPTAPGDTSFAVRETA